ncbi:MAG: hypothetical protein PHY13_02025 [Clostridia bacterium]|nr:hypothetical protein [Clostridia bacterium]MDD3971837.1 hypothetical protein [Clostridia bacterium]MDD4542534.1 hypothetical protein [Clostridia bacterium]
MYYIGINIAKRAQEFYFSNDEGSVSNGNYFQIPNTLSIIDKLIKELDKFVFTPKKSPIGMKQLGIIS